MPPRRRSDDHNEKFANLPYGRGDIVTGIFQASPRRGGYLVPDTAGWPDIRIPPPGVGAALHGDTVEASVSRAKSGQQASGDILRVLRHANKFIVGRYFRAGRQDIVHPKNPKIQRVIHVTRPAPDLKIPEEAWVMVEVRKWSDDARIPLIGRITEVLGTDDDKGIPILLLIKEGGVPIEFTPEIEAEAAALEREPMRVTKDRRDFRADRVFTIDPATAKDFDDAVSLVAVTGNAWRIAVHIADVAHYVRPGTDLDKEAYERATSIYPVDRVIPMLPEALSNRLCSLRPGEDKFTMTAIFNVDRAGRVTDVELCNSVIHSARRFAYEEVQGIFDELDTAAGVPIDPAPTTPRPRPVIPAELQEDLVQVRLAGRALATARKERGSLDLDLPETEVMFDSDGRVSDLRRRERFEAHRLIEELMVAANEAVSRELELRGFPALFRVHDEPDENKLRMIAPVMTRLGIPLPSRGGLSRKQLQHAIDVAHRHPAGTIVQRWLLRSMMRAKYQPENIGHFGLASESYVHFTSPIRRYPDLIIHRIVKALLAGERSGSPAIRAIAESLPNDGRHTSQREQRAQKIEWDAEEIFGLLFMRRYLGDVFEGFIGGTNQGGFFVALRDYPVEGFVPIAQLDDDFYNFDEEIQLWRGTRSGRTFAVGDPVTVLIERIDVLAGRMELILLRGKAQGARPARTGRKSGKPPGRRPGAPPTRRRRG